MPAKQFFFKMYTTVFEQIQFRVDLQFTKSSKNLYIQMKLNVADFFGPRVG